MSMSLPIFLKTLTVTHKHLSNIDCLMVHTAWLICFISTVNGSNKKRSLLRPALVVGTYQTLSNLFCRLSISTLWPHSPPKVAGVKVYPRETWNFWSHAVSACSNHVTGPWYHCSQDVICWCMQLLHGLCCFNFVTDIPLPPATLFSP